MALIGLDNNCAHDCTYYELVSGVCHGTMRQEQSQQDAQPMLMRGVVTTGLDCPGPEPQLPQLPVREAALRDRAPVWSGIPASRRCRRWSALRALSR